MGTLPEGVEEFALDHLWAVHAAVAGSALALLLHLHRRAKRGLAGGARVPGADGPDGYPFGPDALTFAAAVRVDRRTVPASLGRVTFDDRHLRLRSRGLRFFTDVAVDREEVLRVTHRLRWSAAELRIEAGGHRLDRVVVYPSDAVGLLAALAGRGWPVERVP